MPEGNLMNYETIRWDVDEDGIATLTLNRPDNMNAFNLTMARELERAFLEDAQSDDVKAVVVTGAGRAFCAGMDLSVGGNVFGLDESLRPTPNDFRDHYTEPPYHDELRDTGGRLTLAIHALPKPVIAAINGVAVGVGATMTLAMDIRLAATTARIGFVFGRIGIVPEACSSWFLPRLVGLQTALEWIYSSDILSAETAHAGGLLRSLHEPDELLPAAYQLARSFVLNRSPVALALSKQLLYRNSAATNPLEAHLTDSLAVFYRNVRRRSSDGLPNCPRCFRPSRSRN
jgi:enoyl-CoA hydratase/carnithine racemase